MIKMLTAYTFEVEDPEIAVREILEQLDLDHNMLKNAVGLMFCSLDFITTGLAEAVGRALPFDVAGCTTMGILISGGVMGEIILAVAVLTSDDVCFAVGLSEPLVTEEERRIDTLYQRLSASLADPPSFVLAFHPLLKNIGGDLIVNALDRLSGGTPVFGTGALDMDIGVRNPMTIHNGTAYSDCLVLLLVSGPVSPLFTIDFVGEQKTHSQKAVITAAEGNRIVSINNIPAVAYMEKQGLINNGNLDILFAFPLVIENIQREKSVLCIIISAEPDGSLVCGSSVSAGSTLYINSPSAEAVLKTAANTIRQVKDVQEGRDLLLVFSCFSRSIAMVESKEEMNFIRQELAGSSLPCLFLYSGGEICPVKNEIGLRSNRYHNYAIVSCML